MSPPLPEPDANLPPNTVAIGRDGHRVSVVISCPDIATALDLYRMLIEDANERGSLIIDMHVKPRPTVEADDGGVG